MRDLIIAFLVLAGLASMVWSYVLVRRDDRLREQVDDALWVRSIDDYRRRAHHDLAEPGSALDYVPAPRPDPAPSFPLGRLLSLEHRSKQLDRRSIPPQ